MHALDTPPTAQVYVVWQTKETLLCTLCASPAVVTCEPTHKLFAYTSKQEQEHELERSSSVAELASHTSTVLTCEMVCCDKSRHTGTS
eukprot:m.253305 g.253305  ORF g.253305 m.253305 type:complete len:88 (-) comp15483_c1_seq1:3704-3967(-)